MVLGGGVAVCSAVAMHDYVATAWPLPKGMVESMEASRAFGWPLAGYLLLLFAGRVWDSGYHNCYEMLWACNVAMACASVGVLTDRPRLVGAGWVMISLDQLLWYADILSRAIRGAEHPKRWIIGVAKYLDAPETSVVKWWTAWHHLWFSPLCLYMLRFHGYVPPQSYLLNLGIMSVLGAVSRVATPYQCIEPALPEGHAGVRGHHEAGQGGMRVYLVSPSTNPSPVMANVVGRACPVVFLWFADDEAALWLALSPWLASVLAHLSVLQNINLSHKFWKDIRIDFAHRYDESNALLYLLFGASGLTSSTLPRTLHPHPSSSPTASQLRQGLCVSCRVVSFGR